MSHNIDSMKPVLLVDVAMNNYSHDIVSTLSKYDKILPEQLRIGYYLSKYKDLQYRFFKRFFNICRNADIMSYTNTKSANDIAYDIMDSFEEAIMPFVAKLETEIENFLKPLTNDPENIVLLRKIQMNNVLLQMADKLNIFYNKKKDSMIGDMLDINKMLIARLDDREVKMEYTGSGIENAVQELVNTVRDYKYELPDLQQ